MAYRHFAFLGPESVWAAEASECAAEQGRFWEYHQRLLEAQAGVNAGVFQKPLLKRYAAELGLATARFDQCLDTDRYAERVQQETLAGTQLGVQGTPSVFVNGRKVQGAPTLERILQLVQEEIGTSG